MKFRLLILTVMLSLTASVAVSAKMSTEDYIAKYKKAAIEEMKKYGIPASITLAQGILESSSGNSYLALKGNNHFGIKCHRDWDGKKIYRDDDAKNECFRSYKNVEESFRDHSLFLKERARYAALFEESPTDYKAWAKGLKKAGYATNRKYPQLLIDLIERYELHKYDLKGFDVDVEDMVVSEDEKAENDSLGLEVAQINVSTNKVKFIKVREGDTFESISRSTDKRVDELLRYNELQYDAELKEGQIIYLQPKRKRAARDFKSYIVEKGDNMYFISQKFGVRLKYLYRLNDMQVGEQPNVGQEIILR